MDNVSKLILGFIVLIMFVSVAHADGMIVRSCRVRIEPDAHHVERGVIGGCEASELERTVSSRDTGEGQRGR